MPAVTPAAHERLQWFIVASGSVLPAFPDFGNFIQYLTTQVHSLFDIPHEGEPIDLRDFQEMFDRMDGNLLYQSVLMFMVCKGKIQLVHSKLLICKLGNVAGHCLHLVHMYFDQAPDEAPSRNCRVAMLGLVLQPIIEDLLENVQAKWDQAEEKDRTLLQKDLQELIQYFVTRGERWEFFYCDFMDLDLNLVLALPLLSHSIDSSFRQVNL
jgi:hypothetical protein